MKGITVPVNTGRIASKPAAATASVKKTATPGPPTAPRDVVALLHERGSLLPDSAGRIQHLALCYGNKEMQHDLPQATRKALLGMYGILFRNMHPSTHFTVVAATAREAREVGRVAREANAAQRVDIVNANSKKGMSIWIRDSMLPTRDQRGDWTILVQDRTYWIGEDDAQVPRKLGSIYPGMRYKVEPTLRLDGGNVITNKKFAFVGIDSVDQTAERLRDLGADPKTRADMRRFYERQTGQKAPRGERFWRELVPALFESKFNRKVYVVCQGNPPGGDKQPAFHIDMCMTPVGEREFLVGDPSMALDVLSAMSPTERSRWNRNMAAAAGLKPGADVIGRLIKENSGGQQQEKFDNLARELREKGFGVTRIPYLNGLRRSQSMPYVTYNNCLQERYDDVCKVYLPQYGCEPLDAMARSVYQSKGYQIVPLPMAAVTVLEGAIRCSAYPVRRTEVP